MAHGEDAVQEMLNIILHSPNSVSLLAPTSEKREVQSPMLGSDIYASVMAFKEEDGTPFVRWSYRLGDDADLMRFALVYHACVEMEHMLLEQAFKNFGYDLETFWQMTGLGRLA